MQTKARHSDTEHKKGFMFDLPTEIYNMLILCFHLIPDIIFDE